MLKTGVAGLLLLLQAMPGNALACSPPPNEIFASTEKRVRERYASAESIELATITDVKRITRPEGHGNILLKGEKVTFRIDRVFKGQSKPGGKIIVESTNMCDYSVDGNAALKTDWSPYVGGLADSGGIIIPPRQWLFYRPAHSRVVIGPTDMARPINAVSFDLQLLERWRKAPAK